MPESWIDPASLDGDALMHWYQRSPAEVERERQRAATRRYQDFFHGGPRNDPDPGFDREVPASSQDIDPAFAIPSPSTPKYIDPGFNWVAAGPNRWRSAKIANGGQPADPASRGSTSYGGLSSVDRSYLVGENLDAGAADFRNVKSDLTPRPIVRRVGETTGLPAAAFGPALLAEQSAPKKKPYDRVWPQAAPTRAAGYAGKAPASAPAHEPDAGQTIAYGALRASISSDEALAELRKQQAAFADTTRKIDLQNSWFAAPVLAAPLAVMGLEGAAAWAARIALPKAEQAALQFVERDPYLRVGDNWATRAGRRAHAWVEQRAAAKPGWDYEPGVPRPGARPLKPDLGTPPRDPTDLAKRFYLELKPNTPSGRAAAARAVRKYLDAAKRPTRAIYYDPKDFT